MRKVERIGRTWKLKLLKQIRVTGSSKMSTLTLRARVVAAAAVVAAAVLNAQVDHHHQHLRTVAHRRSKSGKQSNDIKKVQ